MIDEKEVYTAEEAQTLLKISRSTFMRLVKKGILRAGKIGGQYRIMGAELLRHVLPQDAYKNLKSDLWKVKKWAQK
jgi:excisionase family DNA binding protein